MHCASVHMSGIEVASIHYLEVRIMRVDLYRQMLEYIYEDMIKKYNQSFLEEYQAEDGWD